MKKLLHQFLIPLHFNFCFSCSILRASIWWRWYISIQFHFIHLIQVLPMYGKLARRKNRSFTMQHLQSNVIITDTINTYPVNDTSRFSFSVYNDFSFAIVAIQWLQKLDIDSTGDIGTIEFSTDGGQTWQNTFNNPYVLPIIMVMIRQILIHFKMEKSVLQAEIQVGEISGFVLTQAGWVHYLTHCRFVSLWFLIRLTTILKAGWLIICLLELPSFIQSKKTAGKLPECLPESIKQYCSYWST